ncbi:MAG: hypothetical protein DK306_001730 [Chloroflexi bacterium]|nr:MAG: hypothetical protein DK306_001730 [Chloroflexota bacterium]
MIEIPAGGEEELLLFAHAKDLTAPDPQPHEIILEVALVNADGSPRDDPDNDNNSAELVIPIIDVGVTTEVASGDPGNPQPGDQITYQHIVTNHRDRAVETVLTNVVPAGTTFVAAGSDPAWVCTDGAVAAGTECTRPVSLGAATLDSAQAPGADQQVTFVVRVNDNHPPGEAINNVATLPTRDDRNPTDNRSPALEAGVRLSAEYDALPQGGLITYTIILDNGEESSQRVTVEVTPDANTTFVPAGSDAAWVDEAGIQTASFFMDCGFCSDEFTLVVSVADLVALDPVPGTLTLDARLLGANSGTRVDPNNADNTASLDVPVIDIAVTTEVEGDPGEPAAGDLITYQHRVTNVRGPALETTLTNVVPTGASFVAAGSDAGWTCTLPDADDPVPAADADAAPAGTVCTRSVSLGAAALSSAQAVGPIPFVLSATGDDAISNVASVPTKGDINPLDNTSPALDLGVSVSVTESHGTLVVDARIVYTITIDNPAAEAQTVTVRGTPDANTTFVPTGSDSAWAEVAGVLEAAVSVAAGESADLVLIVSVADLAALDPGPDVLTLSAALLGLGGNTRDDGDNDNNVAMISIPVVDVRVTTTLEPQSPSAPPIIGPGSTLIHVHTVTNTRGSAVETVLTNNVPANSRLQRESLDSAWDCTGGGDPGSVCTRAVSLAANATVDIRFGVTVLDLPNVFDETVFFITNVVTLATDGDVVPDDNTATVVTMATQAKKDPPPDPGGGGGGCCP